jgi:hypothetical protein
MNPIAENMVHFVTLDVESFLKYEINIIIKPKNARISSLLLILATTSVWIGWHVKIKAISKAEVS